MIRDERRIDTPSLQIAYGVVGPADGAPVLLLHGWPDSAYSWRGVAVRLAEAGRRCYLPHLRGFGATRFVDHASRRSGQATALAQDAVDFADALGLDRFALVGHDWGAFAAYLLAARWPQRVEKLTALSVGYGINDPVQSIDLTQARHFWYQWFLQTEQGHLALETDRRRFCRELWQTWMPAAHFDAGYRCVLLPGVGHFPPRTPGRGRRAARRRLRPSRRARWRAVPRDFVSAHRGAAVDAVCRHVNADKRGWRVVLLCQRRRLRRLQRAATDVPPGRRPYDRLNLHRRSPLGTGPRRPARSAAPANGLALNALAL